MKVKDILIDGFKKLKESGINTYIIDAELILGKVLNLDRLNILISKERICSDDETDLFFRLIDERKRKKPVRYITESVEFMGFELHINTGVLIPRADTETLVEQTIEVIKKHKYKSICDLCCGSGAIGIAIAKFIANAQVTFLDISTAALDVTKINIKKQNITNVSIVLLSDLLEKACENALKFDVIVSNPPYIRRDDIPSLMEDVKDYEPYLALDGGEDGLDFYRKITFQSRSVLNKGGLLAYEIGCEQWLQVKEIMMDNGFKNVYSIKDLAGRDRAIFGFL